MEFVSNSSGNGSETPMPNKLIKNCFELQDHLLPGSETLRIILMSAGWTILSFIVLLLCIGVMMGFIRRLYPRAPEITDKIAYYLAILVMLIMVLSFTYQLVGLYPTIPTPCTITTANLKPNQNDSVYIAQLNVSYKFRGELLRAQITRVIKLSRAWTWSEKCPSEVPVWIRTQCRYYPDDPTNIIFDENEIVLFTCLIAIYGCAILIVLVYRCCCYSPVQPITIENSPDDHKREYSFDDALPDVVINSAPGFLIPSSSQLETLMTLEKNQRILDKFAMLIFELSKFNAWNPLHSPVNTINWGSNIKAHDGAFGTVITVPQNNSTVWKLYPKLEQTPSVEMIYQRAVTAINEICCNWVAKEHHNIISYDNIGLCSHPTLPHQYAVYMTIRRADRELKERYRSSHAVKGWKNPSQMNMIDRLTEGDAIARIGILKQLFDAIQHMHTKGVVHLDLHGGNIRLDEGDQVYISDFGNARYFPLDSSKNRCEEVDFAPLLFKPGLYVSEGWGSKSPFSWTKSDTVSFTLGRRMDIYSLGVIAFQLFFGYVETQREETICHLFNETPLARCKQPVLVDIVSKCLSARTTESSVDDLWKDIGYSINCQLMEVGCSAVWPISEYQPEQGAVGITIQSFFETPSIGLR
eukprot:TRINITY_DN160_c0_g2_i1.p1 TRINITY_DN160_c0_g2~~TRINITY_DN160_c0_g2_i1.p1  ORF type:complete len:639 (-),score=68.23 TRINITY_DN160_c0_g2_i1:799-2715(-)